MLTEDKKRAAYRALEDRVLNGAGQASPELRGRAFRNADLAPTLDELLGNVATRPTQVTDAEFAAAGGWVQRTRALRAGDLRRGRPVRPAV